MLDSIKQAIQAGNFQDALKLCLRLQEREVDNPLFYIYLGAIQTQLGKLQLAEQAFLKALSLDNTLDAPYKNLAQIYKATQNPKAKDFLLLSSWIDPTDTKIFEDLFKNFSNEFSYPAADVVFYTGTPFLKMKFSPDSLETGALGGSETAFAVMARELSRLGKKVICFCNTPERKIYGGVEYIPVVEFFLYNRQHEIPILISSRFLHPFKFPLQAKKKILWLHETRGCANPEEIFPYKDNIDLFLGLSDYQIGSIATLHHLPKEKFIKTRNGFISKFFSDQLTTKQPYSLIYFSRPERGLKQALAVFERVREKFPQTQLHLCFYTQKEKISQDKELQPFLNQLHQDGICYHGGLSKQDLASLLQKTQLCLYPNVSDAETSCIVAIESMAAGTPVITSDRGALPETVVSGTGGVIVPYLEDSEKLVGSLTQIITDLFQNPEKLKTLSQHALERAWGNYRWEDVAKEWFKIL